MPDLHHDLRGLLQRARARAELARDDPAHLEALDRILDTMAAMTAARQDTTIDLRVLCDEAAGSADLPVDVEGAGQAWADEASVMRILVNLLDNAARHATRARIQVKDGEVTVEDDGPGLSNQDAFTMGHSGDGRTGLGLPSSRAMARRMGGDLLWERFFILRLPATKQIHIE